MDDFDGFLGLAAEVEDLFGPLVGEPGFHDAVRRNIARGSALVAVRASASGLVGGLLFSHHRRPRYSIGWLVVASVERSRGVGQALLADAFRRWVRAPCVVDVVTFGEAHPGARARTFYERLGFEPGERVADGPEGGSRQVFRLGLDRLPAWVSRSA